jgi:hypothetical protein
MVRIAKHIATQHITTQHEAHGAPASALPSLNAPSTPHFRVGGTLRTPLFRALQPAPCRAHTTSGSQPPFGASAQPSRRFTAYTEHGRGCVRIARSGTNFPFGWADVRGERGLSGQNSLASSSACLSIPRTIPRAIPRAPFAAPSPWTSILNSFCATFPTSRVG